LKFKLEEFRAWENKRVTLVGMSGVGKSYLSAKLRGNNWFHYSGDYRIGTRYLDEHIIDMIKEQAIKIPFLKDLLRNDWIYIKNNIRVNDLGPVLSFIGKLGNPEMGGARRRRIFTDTRISSTMSAAVSASSTKRESWTYSSRIPLFSTSR